MSPKIHWRFFALVASLLICFSLLQWVLVFHYQIPFFPSTLFIFLVFALLAFVLQKRWIRSMQAYYSKTINTLHTDWKKTLQGITREKEDLQKILEEMSEGVLVLDERGRIQWVNQALRALFSLPEEVAGKLPLEVIRHSDLDEASREALRMGKSSTFDLILPASPQKIFEVNVIPISSLPRNDSGVSKVDGAIAVFHDISRLKELEKIRQDFVANVSHELRTPLTTIKGYAETLLEGALKEEVAIQFVQVINRHADRLKKIVEDLLTLSTIESKEFGLKPERLLVSELINSTLDLVKEEANRKGISVTWNESSPSLSVFGDRKGLEQVLINLLDNAIKYGREGGNIKISVNENPNSEVQVSVQDDGFGIPKEDLPRIFERFYRVDKARSKELGGTGLGLSIVRHLVQTHGGRVWAESQLGEGSTFYFTLPCHPQRS